MTVRPRRVVIPLAAVLSLLALAVPTAASAHVVQRFGPYTLAIGWLHEPTYVGVENAVQVIVKDAAGKSVDDIPADQFHVTVSAAGQSSDPLPLNASFDPDTGLGTPGEYTAVVIPTLAGDYTFHLVGTVHGQQVDASVTSSDKTFDSVRDPSEAQFPAKLPPVGDLAARVERVDQRASAAGAAGQQAAAAASAAQRAADRALVIGTGLGVLGLLVGLVAVGLALRAGRRRGS
ncbi:MAG TPA: hypothetical protein VF763_14280 [Candidatus Limnocylindrales bacterium]